MSMKQKHTPRPWVAKVGNVKITIHDCLYQEPHDERNQIASMSNSSPVSEANARLIAAAPALLAACRALLAACNGLQAAYVGSNGYKYPYRSDLAEEKARAAIAAAEGGAK